MGDIQLVTVAKAFIICQKLIKKSPMMLLGGMLQAQLLGGTGCFICLCSFYWLSDPVGMRLGWTTLLKEMGFPSV